MLEQLADQITELINRYPNRTDIDLARLAIRSMTESELKEAALLYAAELVERARRQAVRVIESQAPRYYVESSVQKYTYKQHRRDHRDQDIADPECLRCTWDKGQHQEEQDHLAGRHADPLGTCIHCVHQKISRSMDVFLAEAKIKWTQELLDAQFALGDGTRVTWGLATVEQHFAQITLLTANVTGNLSTLKLHEQAVLTIREAGAECLNEAALATV